MNASMSDAAHELAIRGYKIFPCHWPVFGGSSVSCSCGQPDCKGVGKHPRTKNGCLDATDDVGRVDKYWQLYPQSNIGFATGATNGVTVIDVDPRHGGDATLARLVTDNGPLPQTTRERTGSGGEHIFFEDVPNTRCSSNKVGPGIDVRSDGGYVVVAPSTHSSGRRYEWMDLTPAAVAPAWLVEKMGGGAKRDRMPPEHWRHMFAAGADAGNRNDSLCAMAGYLVRRKLDPLLVLDIVQMWNRERFRPAAPAEHVESLVDGICKAELRRRR